jgi:hypothetical protein
MFTDVLTTEVLNIPMNEKTTEQIKEISMIPIVLGSFKYL